MYLKAIRSIVVLLLVLAVPVQGTAAVTAGLCMAVGHHDAGHGVDGHDGNSAAHEHPDADHSKPHCAPCVACCAAVAISSRASLFEPDRPAALQIAAVAASFTGISPARLDRPPLAL